MSKPREVDALNWRAVEHLCHQLHTNRRELDSICRNPDRFYYRHEEVVKAKRRELATPQGRLRQILDCLQSKLQQLKLPFPLQGGKRGRSTKSNAEVHIGKAVLVKMDLKDYFPGISNRRVYATFLGLGCTPPVARCLARLTTLDGCLPLGSPTSTIISALVSIPLARRLQGLADQHGAAYTQWVDDITISGPVHVVELKELVGKIVAEEGFRLKSGKTKVQYAHEEQTVTGVRVNSRLDAPSEMLDEIKGILAVIERSRTAGTAIPDKEIRSVEGKIAYVERFNRGAGRFLGRRLHKIVGSQTRLGRR